MFRFLRTLLLAGSTLVFVPAMARAEPPPPRRAFALVVTNNHATELGRPDLRYADDDGVKYAEVFRVIAEEKDVHLLTELDHDTELLAPHLKGKLPPPTRAAIDNALADIRRNAQDALARGQAVDFYFVFAGHGDVDRGKGFLVLRDGRFTADDMEAMLKSIPSTKSHVILDSCNSFFVLSARKPGGRRVALPEDAVRSLRERLPNVGVFLSTSAEAEVYEWAELGAGIFSHAVRSGLLGAADADGDGQVSYDELKAFVHVATSAVKNPLYKPKVFAKGPSDQGSEPIFRLSSAKAARIVIDHDRPIRLTLRDGEDIPWIDLHKEQGAKAVFYVPRRIAEHATVDERTVSDTTSLVLASYALPKLPETAPILLASLSPTATPAAPRGPNEALRMLFGAPFGPRAMATFALSKDHEEQAGYGVSREDVERMRLLLEQVAELRRMQDRQLGMVGLAFGAAFATAGPFLRLSVPPEQRISEGASLALIGLGVGFAGLGTYRLLRTNEADSLYRSFVSQMHAGRRPDAAILAETEDRLFRLATEDRWWRWTGLALSTTYLPLGIIMATQPSSQVEYVTGRVDGHTVTVPYRQTFPTVPMGVGLIGLGGAMFYLLLQPTPIERMVTLWRQDPDLKQIPRSYVRPYVSGTSFGLEGTF